MKQNGWINTDKEEIFVIRPFENYYKSNSLASSLINNDFALLSKFFIKSRKLTQK